MQKTVILTGATGAIGKATALELAKSGCQLILLGRNHSKLAALKSEITAASGNSDIEVVVADLSEPEAIRKAAAEIKGGHKSLNALVNMAAIFKSKRLENSQGLEYMFATNHLGPFILTQELTDLLKAGAHAKVITVSAPSFTKINFDDLQSRVKFSAGFTGIFGATKMMNIMFSYALSRRLEGTGVSTVVFHPGLVKTELTKEMPALLHGIFKLISGKADKPAKMLCSLALDQKFEELNGVFINADGKIIKSNDYSHDIGLQDKLWEISEGLA